MVALELHYFRITREQIDEFIGETPDKHDLGQVSFPLEYTQELVSDRSPVLEDLSATLREHVGDFFRGKTVLEIGPGIEDILFKMLSPSFDGSPPVWYPLDISHGIVQTLSEKEDFSSHNYTPVLGTVRHIPFRSNYFDVVCGLSSLDSIIDFNGVASEIHRVLRPNGHLIHIQDIGSSNHTMLQLLTKDPKLAEKGYPLIYFLGDEGEITHIQFPGEEPMQTHVYLHQGLKREFEKTGKLVAVSMGLREYSSYQSEPFSLANIALSKIEKLPEDCIKTPQYSFLIMQKV